ncbi:MAG: energy transducer TonB [Candidatus Sulfotelmatobacter sp.]
MLRRNWPAVFLALVSGIALAANPSVDSQHSDKLLLREAKLAKSLARASQFSSVPHVSVQSPCEDVQPPEALATPDPLFAPGAQGRKVKVSFIIGVDGRVHSPLILESAGMARDRPVLETVRSWRYRPATCNGVPTETEGKIEFSSR